MVSDVLIYWTCTNIFLCFAETFRVSFGCGGADSLTRIKAPLGHSRLLVRLTSAYNRVAES